MNADIRVENGKLVYGMEDCCLCGGTGKHAGRKPCAKCKGTGRTKGGIGKGECRHCFHGQVVDTASRVPCESCQGTGRTQANSCSYLPDAIYQGLSFKVFRSERGQTWNEYHLGIGCVYSCSDYGEWKRKTDAELIEDVRKERCVQGTKISKQDGSLCQYVGIFCNSNGYSVRAVFE